MIAPDAATMGIQNLLGDSKTEAIAAFLPLVKKTSNSLDLFARKINEPELPIQNSSDSWCAVPKTKAVLVPF
jgi:hypothetical protein